MSYRKKKIYKKIGSLINKDLSNSFVRLEIIGDKTGFWLKPHKDIEEKLMTMMIWANPYNESDILGTDLQYKNFNHLGDWTYNSLNESERIAIIIKKRIIKESI